MLALIALAEKEHWLTAARTMFRQLNPELYDYVADLNRASWIPLLPIGPDSTVLDVGSGLGALTHALALNYYQVVSVEPVAAMVRFTKIRLAQERLDNVDLIQTTLASLPFSGGTFDLIVLNGVLEWVHEWRGSSTSRDAQLAVLRDLRRLLKPRGVIVVASENRMGYTSLAGRTGHPPGQSTARSFEWLDTLRRRLSKPEFYRSLAAPTRRERPYTHTPNGYRDLLRRAGFAGVDVWWPPNGYNSPHIMLRASNRGAIRSYCDFDRRYRDRFHGYALARHLRHWALVGTRLIHKMFPDVILIATCSTEPGENIPCRGPLLAGFETHMRGGGRYYAESLVTHPYKNKTVLSVASIDREANAVVKVANVRLPGAEMVQRSHRKLAQVNAYFKNSDPLLTGSIPSPMAVVRTGSLVGTMETAARGSRLIDLVLDRRYFDRRELVRHHLELIAAWLIASKRALDGVEPDGPIDAIPSEWLIAPGREIGDVSRPAPERFNGAQHGDFYPENVFIDEHSRHITVIDWDTCGTGYPPLFDWFCLVTGLYYTHERARGLPRGHTIEPISFRQTYFETSWFSELVLSLSRWLCEQLGLDRAKLLEYFRLFIAVRYRQFCWQAQLAEKHYLGPLNKDLYEQYYQVLVTNPTECCFWTDRSTGVV